LRTAADTAVDDGDRDRRLQGERPQRVSKAEAAQRRWIDAVGERPQLLDRLLRVDADRFELVRKPLVRCPFLRHPEIDLDRHEPLLRTVVQIALELAPLPVTGFGQPCPGRV
jgi:hypothetical protein